MTPRFQFAAKEPPPRAAHRPYFSLAPIMSTPSKLANNETQEKRGRAFGKVAAIWVFLVCTSIPILNILFGMFLVLWFAKLIFARSGQMGKDFVWLAAGAMLCMFGFAFPAISETWRMGFGAGWVVEVGLNLFVCLFIVGGRLGHLFSADAAEASR